MPSSRRGIQGIFPIQGSNLCLLRLLHCSLPLSHWTRGHSPKTSAPLSGGPGVELKSSSSLLSQALGSGSSGCPLPEGLKAAFWPLPCCVLWRPDRTPAWFRPSSFRWPWTGRPCSQASQLEPHSWQEVVAAIGMRGGASAPLRPSLPLSSLRIPPRQRQRGGCRATPSPTVTQTLPLLLRPLLSGSSRCPIAEDYLAQNLPGLAAPVLGKLGGLE